MFGHGGGRLHGVNKALFSVKLHDDCCASNPKLYSMLLHLDMYGMGGASMGKSVIGGPFYAEIIRVFRPILLPLGSVLVLPSYSIAYGLTAQKARWLGGVTSTAVIILDSNVGGCLFGYELLRSRVVTLLIAGIYRIFLICFGVHYWYLGHCIGYAVVASVLLGAAVTRHFSASDATAARRAFLESARVRLREGFRRKGPGSCSSLSEGHGSSAKYSSSVDPSQIVLWQGVAQGGGAGVGGEDGHEGLNSARSIDSGRGSLPLHTSSRPST
eukprot:c10418_g1_i1 orf=80-892(+)